MLNDAFILGGIHGDSQFELALPFTSSENGKDITTYLDENPDWLWPAEQPFPAVLLRELIGLKFAGYQPYLSDAGLAFACTKPQLAQAINHEAYLKELDSLLQDRQQALMTIKDYLNDIAQIA
ncbi:hypothetical protein [Endozoicomonas arenosclerae]|uniref:hypothetical protein n=1 Tax=Endozoicomonas arenosclerae TaxID=1633495 RepID=UPI0007815283|nr:hypothetical protein [Endozoicomonas arenosclerae]